jgi:hypothetical protein
MAVSHLTSDLFSPPAFPVFPYALCPTCPEPVEGCPMPSQIRNPKSEIISLLSAVRCLLLAAPRRLSSVLFLLMDMPTTHGQAKNVDAGKYN